jgi:amidase
LPVRTLKELIQRNKEIPEELPPAFPQQDMLEKDLSFKLENWTPEEAAKNVRVQARKRVDDALAEHDVDVIIGPADSSLTSFAAAAGYPLAALPVDVLEFNRRPFGVTAITRAHGEPLLIQLMSAWEMQFPRKLPETLKKMEKESLEREGS